MCLSPASEEDRKFIFFREKTAGLRAEGYQVEGKVARVNRGPRGRPHSDTELAGPVPSYTPNLQIGVFPKDRTQTPVLRAPSETATFNLVQPQAKSTRPRVGPGGSVPPFPHEQMAGTTRASRRTSTGDLRPDHHGDRKKAT